MPGRVVVDARACGIAGCGGVSEGFGAAEVVAGECGVGVQDIGVDGDLGAEVGMLGEEELPTPLAPTKWTCSTVKSSYVEVEPLSTALSHAHPRPPLNTSRAVRTRRVFGSRMR